MLSLVITPFAEVRQVSSRAMIPYLTWPNVLIPASFAETPPPSVSLHSLGPVAFSAWTTIEKASITASATIQMRMNYPSVHCYLKIANCSRKKYLYSQGWCFHDEVAIFLACRSSVGVRGGD